jgi:predicted RNA binding protein YcfA (HicA-like mRNA interferase family)
VGDKKEKEESVALFKRLWHFRDMKVRDAIKQVEADGWAKVSQEGSHRQYKHPSKSGKVTIAGHPTAELAPKTRKSIFEQAGLLK